MTLNQSRLSTAEGVAQEIEDYCDATEEFSRDDKSQAGFIAPVGQGPVKGGKPGEAPYNFGKGKAKEKCTKDSDYNPSVVNSESLVDIVFVVGESGTKEAQCWLGQGYMKSNPPQDPLQRDFRE